MNLKLLFLLLSFFSLFLLQTTEAKMYFHFGRNTHNSLLTVNGRTVIKVKWIGHQGRDLFIFSSTSYFNILLLPFL